MGDQEEKKTTDYRELTYASQDREILKHFYHELYLPEFPDPDERESLENMEQYLALKEQGWYGKNNYHITIAIKDGNLLAATITDFLAEANAGVIEFLVVSPKFRQGGIGKAILEFTEALLMKDARESLGCSLDCMVCEMNDPFQPTDVQDNLDPAKRTLIWHKWGYRGIDFPYVQPALSESQQSVFNLLLLIKTFNENWQQIIPSQRVKLIVHEYLRWAMRIEKPQDNVEYREMATFLDSRQKVNLLSLARYVGYDSAKPMEIRKVLNAADPDFSRAMSVYQNAFPPGSLIIEPQDFVQVLSAASHAYSGYTYHLWAIRTEADAKVEGMASFFSLPIAGFGGYVAFEGSLSGSWRSRLLIARIEQQMLADQEPGKTEGWYVETDLAKPRAPFLRLGFYEVDLDYEQPPLTNEQTGSIIRLYYKPFGRSYGKPKITSDRFLGAIAQIFKVVYGIDKPQEHPCYLHLEAQVSSLSDEWIGFR